MAETARVVKDDVGQQRVRKGAHKSQGRAAEIDAAFHKAYEEGMTQVAEYTIRRKLLVGRRMAILWLQVATVMAVVAYGFNDEAFLFGMAWLALGAALLTILWTWSWRIQIGIHTLMWPLVASFCYWREGYADSPNFPDRHEWHRDAVLAWLRGYGVGF